MTAPSANPSAEPSADTPPATSRLLGKAPARLTPFAALVAGSAGFQVVLLLAIIWVVGWRAWPAFHQFGLGFLTSQIWNPVSEQFGALPLIYGTLVTSLLALLVAAPFGLSVAIFLSEDLLPGRVSAVLAFLVELLAAIPSVIYGLWGLVTVIPLTTAAGRWLYGHFSSFPLFSTPPVGPGILPASLVLAIMVLPTIAALSRATLRTVPAPLTEAAYALGATRWQVLLRVTLPSAWTGITGAIILALGRALGETMALAMLIGNNNRISPSLLAPGNTIASLLANGFGEASGLELSALMYLSFVLMATTLMVNFAAQRILNRSPAIRTHG